MTRGPSTFRQRDVTRALKAALAAGMTVQSVEIDKAGKIVIVASEAEGETVGQAISWDEVLGRADH